MGAGDMSGQADGSVNPSGLDRIWGDDSKSYVKKQHSWRCHKVTTTRHFDQRGRY